MWWVGVWRASGDIGYGPFNEVVAGELFDYHAVIKGIPVLYDSITGGRISKPTTSVSAVINVVDDRMQDNYDDGYHHGYQVGYEIGREIGIELSDTD